MDIPVSLLSILRYNYSISKIFSGDYELKKHFAKLSRSSVKQEIYHKYFLDGENITNPDLPSKCIFEKVKFEADYCGNISIISKFNNRDGQYFYRVEFLNKYLSILVNTDGYIMVSDTEKGEIKMFH